MLGMIVNGVFDRHPKLKVIIGEHTVLPEFVRKAAHASSLVSPVLAGHMGEKIPIDLWRIDHWLNDVHKPRGATKMQRRVREYFARNIWVSRERNVHWRSGTETLAIYSAHNIR